LSPPAPENTLRAVCGDVGEGVGEKVVLVPSEEILDLLSELVDKSLVVAEGGNAGAERYRLLETLRQYGQERLVASGDAAALHQRHAAYFQVLAERAIPEIGSPQRKTGLDR